MSFKVCLIGCGAHSALAHGPAHRRYAALHPDTELAACCDLDIARARDCVRRFGYARAYADHEAMLATERPDAVVLVVPERATCRIARSVLERGIPLMLEKPPGIDLGETRDLIAAAERTGAIHQVAFNRRFIPLIGELKRLIRASDRQIRAIHYHFYRKARTEPTFETTAIHGVDAVRHIANRDYRRVEFDYQELPERGPGVVNMLLDCELDGGVHARLSFYPCAGIIAERAEVIADEELFELHLPIWGGIDSPGGILHFRDGALIETLPGDAVCPEGDLILTDGFYGETSAFFDAVRAGIPCASDLKSCVQSMAVMDALRARAKCLNFE